MHSTGHTPSGDRTSGYAEIDNPRSVVRIRKFQQRHVDDIVRRDSTGEYRKLQENGFLDFNIKGSRWVYSAVNSRDEAIAVAGAFEYWEGRAEAWAYMTTFTKSEFFSVHRSVKRFLDLYVGRMECVVYADFNQGRRWARLLGFQPESKEMKHYFPGGKSAYLYARIRGVK